MAITRITNNIITNNMLRNIQKSMRSIIEAQDEIASGLEVRRPSDDPAIANRILTLRTNIAQVQQYIQNADHAKSQIDAAETVLDDASEILLRVLELAQEAANDTENQLDKNAVATEINQLLEGLLDTANSTFAGISLFSGNETNQPPFSAKRVNGEIVSVQYNGDSAERLIQIGLNNFISFNIPGDEAFKGGDRDIFDTLIQLRDILRSGGQPGIVEISKDDYDHIATLRTEMGAKAQRIEMIKSRSEDNEVALTELLSQVEEVDITEVITTFRMQELVMNAVLSSGARTLQLSLFNYV